MRVNTRYITPPEVHFKLNDIVKYISQRFEDVPLVEFYISQRFEDVPLVEFYISQRFEDVPLVEFTYLVFTRMSGESYRRRLRSLLLCLCYVFRALVNSLVC